MIHDQSTAAFYGVLVAINDHQGPSTATSSPPWHPKVCAAHEASVAETTGSWIADGEGWRTLPQGERMAVKPWVAAPPEGFHGAWRFGGTFWSLWNRHNSLYFYFWVLFFLVKVIISLLPFWGHIVDTRDQEVSVLRHSDPLLDTDLWEGAILLWCPHARSPPLCWIREGLPRELSRVPLGGQVHLSRT